MRKLALMACLACALGVSAAEQQKNGETDSRIWLPIGISIVAPPLQMPSPSHFVFGAMLNLGYGQVDGLAVLDLGLVNNVTDEMLGLELGPVNLAGTCFGAQVGAVNISARTVGVQLGVLNMTGSLHGVQLGVLNFSRSGGAFIFPLFNLGF